MPGVEHGTGVGVYSTSRREGSPAKKAMEASGSCATLEFHKGDEICN
jgi:hypothetical protein